MDENIGRPGENSFGNQAFSDSSNNSSPKNSNDSGMNSEDAWGNNQAKKIEDQKAAQKEAREAETAATENGTNPNNALAAEQVSNYSSESFYKKDKDQAEEKKKKKRKFKKYGPIGAIIGIMITVMVTFSGSTLFAPFALVANGLEQFNTLRASMNIRTSYIMPRMIKGGGLNSSLTTKGIFGRGSEKFKISDSMSKKLGQNGIKYIETTGTDGNPLNLLFYEDGPNGKPMAIASYDGDKSRIPSTIELPSAEVDASGNRLTTSVNIDTDSHYSFKDAMKSDSGFFKAEEKSTRTLKGHIAGWFDTVADKVDTMLGNGGRNKMGNLSKDASDEEIQKSAQADGIKEESENTKGQVQAESADEIDPDESSPVPVGEGTDEIKPGMDTESATHALTERAKKAAAAIGKASAIATAAGYSCAIMKVINQISQTVAGINKAKTLNFTTTALEAFDKAKAGDSSTEAHYIMNGLNQRGVTRDHYGNVIPGKESTSAWMSPAILGFFSNGHYNIKSNDPVAKKFNSELAVQRAVYHSNEVDSSDYSGNKMDLGAVLARSSGSLATYKGCVAISRSGNAIGLFAEIAGVILSGGISEFVKNVTGTLLTMAQATAISLAVGGIISFIVPTIAKSLAKNFIANMTGEDSAYILASGFHQYTAMQHRMSSGHPTKKSQLVQDYQAKQEVIANESRFARETLSPLDASSPYTFMGSIMNSLIPVAITVSSPIQTVSRISNVFSSSVKNLLPSASAADMTKLKTSVNENCPSANATEDPLVMDAFCNNYISSDYSTIHMAMDDVVDHVGSSNLDFDKIDENVNNGNPPAKDGSELSKWIIACALRESSFNVADSNIASAVTPSAGVGTGITKQITGAVIGTIPIVGQAIQLAGDVSEEANLKWITGEGCSDDSSKYFSRYSEDQRLLESAGLIEQSAVTAYMDKYFEKNPLDNSESGIIARKTGMSKEDAEIGLGLIDYNTYLANYHPKEKGPKLPTKIEDYQYESSSVIAEVLPSSLVTQFAKFSEQRLVTAVA